MPNTYSVDHDNFGIGLFKEPLLSDSPAYAHDILLIRETF